MTELNSKQMIANSRIMGAELRNLANFLMGNSSRVEVPKPYKPTEEEKCEIININRESKKQPEFDKEVCPEVKFVKDIMDKIKNLQKEVDNAEPPLKALIPNYENMKSSEKKKRINRAITRMVEVLSKKEETTLEAKDIMAFANETKIISNTCNKQQYLKMLDAVIEKLNNSKNPIAKDIAEAFKSEREQEILRKKFNLSDYINHIFKSVGDDYKISQEDTLVLAKMVKLFLDNIEVLSFNIVRESKDFKNLESQLSEEFIELINNSNDDGNESTSDENGEEPKVLLSPEEMQEFYDFYNEIMNEK